MRGYYADGPGGTLTSQDQSVAEIVLETGTYIFFAKALVAIKGGVGNSIQARLFVGDKSFDAMDFDLAQNKQTFTSIALNCAAEFDGPLKASLRFHWVVDVAQVIVSNPTLSAIQVGEIHVGHDTDPPTPQVPPPPHLGPF